MVRQKKSEFRFNHIGHLLPTKNWGMGRHVHPQYHEMIVVLGGTIQTQIADRTLMGHAGHVLWYPMGEPHVEKAVGRDALETLYFSWYSPQSRPENWPLMVVDRDGRIQTLTRWMYQLAHMGSKPDPVMLNAMLGLMLTEYQTLRPDPENDALHRVRQHIQYHLSHRLTLDDLAAVAQMSKYHFARFFSRATGVAPMRYVAQRRVEAARTLLLTTPAPLKQIARSVGFSDEFQLSRVFHRITGQAPGQVRREANPK